MRLGWPAALLGLAGCAGSAGPAAPLTFPEHVGSFVRTTEPEAGRTGMVAGYEFTEPGGPIIATVNVRPQPGAALLPSLTAQDPGDPAAARELLDRSEAQVRHFYPAAKVATEGEALMMIQGRLQTGQRARMVFTDILAGKEQPIALEIVVMCCDTASRSYEYRFRFPANLTDELPIAEFKRGFRLTK